MIRSLVTGMALRASRKKPWSHNLFFEERFNFASFYRGKSTLCKLLRHWEAGKLRIMAILK
jgi:hypothetical protein